MNTKKSAVKGKSGTSNSSTLSKSAKTGRKVAKAVKAGATLLVPKGVDVKKYQTLTKLIKQCWDVDVKNSVAKKPVVNKPEKQLIVMGLFLKNGKYAKKYADKTLAAASMFGKRFQNEQLRKLNAA